VMARHPQSEFLPAVAGNCQGGWAIMMALAVMPERAGVVAISGAPMSYWAGKRGRDPMRYTGGLNGGAWPATFMGDIGNGQFDGAWLVTNFERLNPANSYWKKLYDVYAKAGTEGPRFLDFERWWGGYFVLTTDEIRFIVNELFVGNKLAQGRIVTSSGQPVDLRRIQAPIVVICSHGDNITPPQQALNWILDLYDTVEEIKAAEQTIVYIVHPTVGHLGIFVSGQVALKEHAEFISAMDQLEALPPGLYEMVIDECEEGTRGADRFVVHLETRTLEDIRALDDGRDDELPMAHVARLSEIGESLYEQLVRPGVKALANDTSATMLRELHPDRMARRLISDANPFVAPLAQAADRVREQRRPMAEDNLFLQAERAMSEGIVDALDRYRDARDRMQEQIFYAIWTHPLTVALAGNLAPYAEANKPQASRRKDFEDQVALKLEAIKARCRAGGFEAGLIRILVAGVAALPGIDPRALRAARSVWKRENMFTDLGRGELLQLVKEEAFLVQFDREHAMATLPDLLRTRDDRERALRIAREVLAWRPDLMPLLEPELERVEEVLGLRGRSERGAVELLG